MKRALRQRYRQSIYIIEEYNEMIGIYQHPWVVKCTACLMNCACVGTCIGDAMAALPCTEEQRLASWSGGGENDRPRGDSLI